VSEVEDWLDSPEGRVVTIRILEDLGRRKLHRLREVAGATVTVAEFWWLLPALLVDGFLEAK
jgi:hypothetical protein